jgi:hypothetical protein
LLLLLLLLLQYGGKLLLKSLPRSLLLSNLTMLKCYFDRLFRSFQVVYFRIWFSHISRPKVGNISQLILRDGSSRNLQINGLAFCIHPRSLRDRCMAPQRLFTPSRPRAAVEMTYIYRRPNSGRYSDSCPSAASCKGTYLHTAIAPRLSEGVQLSYIYMSLLIT